MKKYYFMAFKSEESGGKSIEGYRMLRVNFWVNPITAHKKLLQLVEETLGTGKRFIVTNFYRVF